MKKCINCSGAIRDDDIYCRNCGLSIKSNSYYVFINILTIISVVALIMIIILFIASYLVK